MFEYRWCFAENEGTFDLRHRAFLDMLKTTRNAMKLIVLETSVHLQQTWKKTNLFPMNQRARVTKKISFSREQISVSFYWTQTRQETKKTVFPHLKLIVFLYFIRPPIWDLKEQKKIKRKKTSFFRASNEENRTLIFFFKFRWVGRIWFERTFFWSSNGFEIELDTTKKKCDLKSKRFLLSFRSPSSNPFWLIDLFFFCFRIQFQVVDRESITKSRNHRGKTLVPVEKAKRTKNENVRPLGKRKSMSSVLLCVCFVASHLFICRGWYSRFKIVYRSHLFFWFDVSDDKRENLLYLVFVSLISGFFLEGRVD